MKKIQHTLAANKQDLFIKELFQLRNQFGSAISVQKKTLLEKINVEQFKSKQMIELLYDTLLFLLAYPDNKTIYTLAEEKLTMLENYVQANETIQTKLYNTGVTGSVICSQFSFEIVKWLRKRFNSDVYLDSIAAPDSQITYIISAVMPQVESEILQDENSTWKEWLKQCTTEREDLLDTLLNLFDQSDIRPEVKDELWNALGIYVTVRLAEHTRLPDHLIARYYHKALIKKGTIDEQDDEKPVQIKLSTSEAEKIIECGRMILVRHSREFDPISFSELSFVSYYHLHRGISIALLGMRPERRHPIDSYMGYIVFKNGLPLSYGGSWILFDSARIALNIFPSYRGGESAYTFEQILKLHKHVYRLNRFSVDPYQIGKHNSDGINSGSFWIYYKFGFRPMREELKQLAASEHEVLKTKKNYRSPASVLKKLANGRLELIINKNSAVRFDATDSSIAYWKIVKLKYGGNRKIAEKESYDEILKFLKLPEIINDVTLQYVIKNWCVLLMADSAKFHSDKSLAVTLKKLFLLKAQYNEEEYINLLQNNMQLSELINATLNINFTQVKNSLH